MSGESGHAFAARFQQAFEMYLIALVFTVLGLAVQTSPAGQPTTVAAIETLGWVSLLVSGLVGIVRLEWIPVAHKMHAELRAREGAMAQIQARIIAGDETVLYEGSDDPMPIETALETATKEHKSGAEKLANIERKTRARYVVHKWGLVLGFSLLLLARALPRFMPTTAPLAL